MTQMKISDTNYHVMCRNSCYHFPATLQTTIGPWGREEPQTMLNFFHIDILEKKTVRKIKKLFLQPPTANLQHLKSNWCFVFLG